MKLAKKNGQAVLSFEINGLTRVGQKVRVAHDVKIEVMRPADVERLSEPLCPEPDVRFTVLGVSVGLIVHLDYSYIFYYLRCRNSGRWWRG